MADDARTRMEVAMSGWRAAADALVLAAENYRLAHANAYLAATGADAARKAAADSLTSELRLARNHAETAERAAYHWMIFCRGSAGEAERRA